MAYDLRTFECSLTEQEYAVDAAKALGMAPEYVFKTLVVYSESQGEMFVLIPSDRNLNLKALAKLCHCKTLRLIDSRRLRVITGYVRGSVTVFAAKKRLPVFVDEFVRSIPILAISAGELGKELLVSPTDFLNLTNAVVGALAV